MRDVIALMKLNYDGVAETDAKVMENLTDNPRMESPVEGLYASQAETLSFAPSLSIRAFVLSRSDGNLLIYSVPGMQAYASQIKQLGGITRQYLNHRHEAVFLEDRLDVPLYCHREEALSVRRRTPVDETFSDRHKVGDDFEIVPTPGHTSGATAYLWKHADRRCLFTGDTLFLNEGEWDVAVLPSSDRTAYAESLQRIQEIDFDVLVPWAATQGQPYVAHTNKEDTRRRINAVLEKMGTGRD